MEHFVAVIVKDNLTVGMPLGELIQNPIRQSDRDPIGGSAKVRAKGYDIRAVSLDCLRINSRDIGSIDLTF
jgi:hypothetical protein